jgi:hypothetical protein
MSELICRCHASHLYASLLRCPGCGYHRYVPWARCWERRACAHEGRPASEQGRLL